MKKTIWLVLIILGIAGCQSKEQGSERIAVIKTDYGSIKIKLYDATPLHRDNFVKLVSEKFYDDLLFHRVIPDFMIQTGDPDSREARVGQALGNGGTGYNIAPEFDSTLFHKRGVIAAARQGDEVNPEKKSSGSQFYIVQGKVYSNKELDELEVQMQEVRKRSFFYQFMNQEANMAWKLKLDSAYQSDNQEVFNEIATELQIVVDSIYSQLPPFKFSAQQRQLYSTIGGTPFLDGEYTVFGEVIEGLDIIDKIAKVKADETNRPVKDIRIKSIRIIN